MVFNSISFAIFFPIVFLVYWGLNEKKNHYQNILILISSYIFYGFWDYRFLFLLIFSTFLDYYSGIKIHNSNNSKNKKIWLTISVFANLLFLGFFKYFNFFVENANNLFKLANINKEYNLLNIIIPIGISFYTFHGISYVIDIYYNKIIPEKKLINYSLFVSFFPLLVAGPIERATNLLPQINTKRHFNYKNVTEGLKQILWGLFKKVAIADNLARFANDIFGNYNIYNGSTLLIGSLFFTIQIYCDFSGYSDMAQGVAKMLGFKLVENFNYPYFSRNITEFWKRWHISLSSWFRDYVYIPLGGSKLGINNTIVNTLIIFLISGFWHGANWTFLFWGLLNAIFIIHSIFVRHFSLNFPYKNLINKTYSIIPFFPILTTFIIVNFLWIFFRSNNISQAFAIFSKIFSSELFNIPFYYDGKKSIIFLILAFIMFFFEWQFKEFENPIVEFTNRNKNIINYLLYYTLCFLIFYFSGPEQQFIYFQF